MATLTSLTVTDTGAMQLPVGTTAERPASPTVGMMRYNTDISKIETWDGTEWYSFRSFSGTITAQLSSPSRTGPTSISTAYTGDLAGRVTISSGIQSLTVPYAGWYRITAYGAQGGRNSTAQGGGGAKVGGEFWIDKDEVIRFLIGSSGADNSVEDCDSGGGGGTYVLRNPYNTLSSILVIAGGGGGSSQNYSGYIGVPSRPDYQGSSGKHGQGEIEPVHGRGGWGGSGGTTGDRSLSGSNRGNPGGGFFGGGNSGSSNPTWPETTAGYSYLDGGNGGTPNDANSFGGFGGGGGGHGNCFISGGGGGGFNGGGCQVQYSNWHGGCGGSSYNNGMNQENVTGFNYNSSGASAFGYATIERVG